MSHKSAPDIVLLHPSFSVNERYGRKNLGRIGGNLPPLGLASIAGVLRSDRFGVAIMDCSASGLSEQAVVATIREMAPKVVGITAITPVFHRAVGVANRIKTALPETLMVLGGHHASIFPDDILGAYPAIDLIVYGEGEQTALDIMRQFQKKGSDRSTFLADAQLLEGINGIVYRTGDICRRTAARPLIEDLDTLPYPAWDLLPMERYLPLPNQYLRLPVVHLVATRGCAFDCSFCSTHAVFGRRLRALSPGRLGEMIAYVTEKFAAREISFWDDSFTTDKEWVRQVCERMLTLKRRVSWSCYSRVDTVDQEMLRLMRRAGCWNIFYGFETGTQQLLDLVDKNVTVERIRQVNAWTKAAGIEVRASFMLALPGETPQSAARTVDFAIALEPDYAQFCLTTPYPGTRLYQQALRYGALDRDFSRYNHWEPVFVPHGWHDCVAIEQMARRALRRFYLRPRYLWGRLQKIHSPRDLLRYLKGLRMLLGLVYS